MVKGQEESHKLLKKMMIKMVVLLDNLCYKIATFKHNRASQVLKSSVSSRFIKSTQDTTEQDVKSLNYPKVPNLLNNSKLQVTHRANPVYTNGLSK